MKKETEKIEIPFGAKDSELYKFEYTIPEGYEAEIKDGKVIMKKKESEDERIREELWEYFHNLQLSSDCDFSPSFTIDDVLAYIERQKEQKPEIKYVYPKFRKGDVIEPITPNGHCMPVRVVDIWNGSYSCRSDDDKAYLSLPIRNEDEYRLAEQKPAEWSEEDEEMFDAICAIIRMGVPVESSAKAKIDWLRSLRPQPHWKPSKKQIDALNSIILTGSFTYVGQTQDLISLKNELKKLM